MRSHLRNVLVASALTAGLSIAASPAQAGGFFGMHVGSGGFGVTVGVGDWGPYTNSWTNPRWSLDYNASLSGYGEWVWVGNLGKVWRPWVSPGWRPYTYGRWVFTNVGWTWVAYEPWGYVPHHYGSWAMCSFGWVWVPGYSYSCGNVVWVRSGGYVGWYARPPRGWSHAARGYRHGYQDGYRDGWHDARYATYVDWHHMASDNISHYAVTHTVASRGRVEDHAAAPTVDEIRRRGGISVPETPVSRRTVTMNGRHVTVARPEGVARNIEDHASSTAARALSSAALERRQPQVRARAPVSVTSTTGRDSGRDLPTDRRTAYGERSESPTRPVTRDSDTVIDAPDRTGRGAVGSQNSDHVRQPPTTTTAIGSSRDPRTSGRSSRSAGSGSSFSTGTASGGNSPRIGQGPGVRTSTPATQLPPRSGAVPDRSQGRAEPPPNVPPARLSGGASASRQQPVRSTSVARAAAPVPASGEANGGSRRRAAAPEDAGAEPVRQPPRRSHTTTQRQPD